MFNPVFETYPSMWNEYAPAMVASQPEPLEIVSEYAILDQMIAFQNLSYDKLLGIYMETNSVIERQAIKQIVMAADWQFRADDDTDDVTAHVQNLGYNKGQYGLFTWANEDRQALMIDARNLSAKQDDEFAKFLFGLVDSLDEVQYYRDEEQRYQYQRNPIRW